MRHLPEKPLSPPLQPHQISIPCPISVYFGQQWLEIYSQSFAAIDAAIADYPNARKHLIIKLAAAEKALADFQKANDLIE